MPEKIARENSPRATRFVPLRLWRAALLRRKTSARFASDLGDSSAERLTAKRNDRIMAGQIIMTGTVVF